MFPGEIWVNVAVAPGTVRTPILDRQAGHLRYRADIDGLRAIAILPVVLYHAGIPGFKGGFVGVDVFFVISGYLMASLIMREIIRGEFNLLRFYERRIRRIFPALFAMFAACGIMAWLFFMPAEFEYFARSLRAAAFFTSNFQFERESGYFDIGTQMKPLVHTWSLAVEEQFYIFFPLVLILLGRFARRYIAPILLTLLIASLAASVWAVHTNPVSAFYLTQFRIWELLLGSLLAFNVLPAVRSRPAREAVAALGILLIVYAVIAFDDSTPFPGLAALVPCIGAALVIHGHATNGPAGRLLTARPMVFIGLISYSLYLWHWPAIVFTRYLVWPELSPVQGVLVVLGAIAAAILSWRFIERPFRNQSGFISRRPLFAGAIAAVVASVILGDIVVEKQGVPERLPEIAQRIYSAKYDVARFSGPGCSPDRKGQEASAEDVRSGKLCNIGKTDSGEPKFLVWGDSHAEAMGPAIDAAASQAGVRGLTAPRPSCPPLFDVQLSDPLLFEKCREFNAAIRDMIAEQHIPLVFLVAYWPKYVHDAELPNQGIYFDPSVSPSLEDHSAPIAAALDRTLAELTRQGTKVVLVMDVPEMGRNIPEALAKAAIKGGSADVAPPWSYVEKRQALARSTIETYARKYDAMIVDPLPAFCSNGHCAAARDGVPLYRDADHLTATAARNLSYLYAHIFQPD
ncbi:acyltransferase [Mesorhizobium sp. DCY119]|nr:acyltransferase [Mesorhizobium sp. DCY119]